MTPLLDAEPMIELHVLCASIGLLPGPVSRYQLRRGRLHKVVGYVWVLAMGATALSAFFVHALVTVRWCARLWLWRHCCGHCRDRAGVSAQAQGSGRRLLGDLTQDLCVIVGPLCPCHQVFLAKDHRRDTRYAARGPKPLLFAH